MRIAHLEDLIFESDVNVNEIVRGIHKRAYPLSIKWDGSPAFVIDSQHIDYGIAFKNEYVRKNRKIYRSARELAVTIADPYLSARMISVFEKFRIVTPPKIIHGEFMFDKDTIDSNGEFQPNTVRYKTSHPAGLCVAIHSIDGKIQSNLVMETSTKFPQRFPDIQYTSVELKDKVEIFNGLGSTHKDKFKRWVNAGIREEIKDDWGVTALFDFYKDDDAFSRHIATYAKEWDKVMTAYAVLMQWKNHVLANMKVDYIVQPADGYEHEGIVVDLGFKLVKLVNRHKFSRMNFARHKHGRQSVS